MKFAFIQTLVPLAGTGPLRQVFLVMQDHRAAGVLEPGGHPLTARSGQCILGYRKQSDAKRHHYTDSQDLTQLNAQELDARKQAGRLRRPCFR